MPKLIITIEETIIEVPGRPEAKLCGLETSSNIEIEESEIGQPSVLYTLAPILIQAISEAQKQHVGQPLYQGLGPMAASREEALKLAETAEFPGELDA